MSTNSIHATNECNITMGNNCPVTKQIYPSEIVLHHAYNDIQFSQGPRCPPVDNGRSFETQVRKEKQIFTFVV